MFRNVMRAETRDQMRRQSDLGANGGTAAACFVVQIREKTGRTGWIEVTRPTWSSIHGDF
jgi:hypothetical protein